MNRLLPRFIVSKGVQLRRTRLLPLSGTVKAKVGDRVKADEVVASAEADGQLHRIDAAKILGVDGASVSRILRVREGDVVKAGQTLGEQRGIWGRGYRKLSAPVDGVVEVVSSHRGELFLREPRGLVELSAALSGVVRAVIDGFGVEIEGRVSLVQGVMGIGGEVSGTLIVAQSLAGFLADAETPALKGEIIVTGESLRADQLRSLARLGLKGVVAGSIDALELTHFVGSFVNPASTGQERSGLTVMITEGFGEIPMQPGTFELLAHLAEKQVVLNGATHMRAGAKRPELISEPLDSPSGDERQVHGEIAEKMSVRVARGSHLGKTALVKKIFDAPVIIETGAKVFAIEVELPDGEAATVPLGNVEMF